MSNSIHGKMPTSDSSKNIIFLTPLPWKRLKIFGQIAHFFGNGEPGRHRFFQKPERYFDYFTRLLNQPGISLSGDITPSYGCLYSSTLRWVVDEFEQRGIRTCAVFILRDPVERFLSQQRMKLKAGHMNQNEMPTAPVSRPETSRTRQPTQQPSGNTVSPRSCLQP